MGRAATVKSESAASMAVVCLGSSTVPAAVVIVVKYRACLLISWFCRQIGIKSCYKVSS